MQKRSRRRQSEDAPARRRGGRRALLSLGRRWRRAAFLGGLGGAGGGRGFLRGIDLAPDRSTRASIQDRCAPAGWPEYRPTLRITAAMGWYPKPPSYQRTTGGKYSAIRS